ncbi:MAG: CDP-alcohol phosphatidyltransferase family protein [Ignavibacteriales bacterium]|nr:CDP-alcohol phosphatidyltransferase family protein [Ignavibacteriales bacterium]
MSIPNSLTALRILLTPVFLILLYNEDAFWKQIALLVYIVAALTDWYDGWVARRYGYVSRWGQFFDPLADKILSLSALFAFVHLNLIDGWMVWTITIRDAIITTLRSYAEWTDRPIVTSKSAQAKTFGEYIVIYYILILYVASTIPFFKLDFKSLIESLMHPQVLFGMMLLVTISTIGTGILYLIDNRKLLQELYVRYFGASAK